jgi:hypothetical protein
MMGAMDTSGMLTAVSRSTSGANRKGVYTPADGNGSGALRV